jgi:hypothetical protein
MALNLDTLGLSATVTAEGISAPDYQTILDTLTSYFQQIYGSDAYLEPDSKDGQMVAIYALAIHDANNTAIAVYNSFSPSTGIGRALSSNVKINGIVRKGPPTLQILFWKVSPERSSLQAWCEMKTGNYGLYQQTSIFRHRRP